MRQPPKWVADQALKILPANKRVLAVEDDLDAAVYTKWMEKLAADSGTIVYSQWWSIKGGFNSSMDLVRKIG